MCVCVRVLRAHSKRCVDALEDAFDLIGFPLVHHNPNGPSARARFNRGSSTWEYGATSQGDPGAQGTRPAGEFWAAKEAAEVPPSTRGDPCARSAGSAFGAASSVGPCARGAGSAFGEARRISLGDPRARGAGSAAGESPAMGAGPVDSGASTTGSSSGEEGTESTSAPHHSQAHTNSPFNNSKFHIKFWGF